MHHVPMVKDCMHQTVVALRPETDITEAIEILLDKDCPGAPVIDENKQLVGILTEKDCLRVLSNYAVYSIKGGTVGDYMSEPRAHVHPDMDLFGAANRFLATNFATLPVLQDGELVGCLSRNDMLRGILKLERDTYKDQNAQRRHQKVIMDPKDKKSMQDLVASEAPDRLAGVLRHRHDRT
jgi:predicted transcriptional regulator